MKMTNAQFDSLKSLFFDEIIAIGGSGHRKYENFDNVSKRDLAKFVTFMLNNGFTVIKEPNKDEPYNKSMRYGFIAVSFKERETREIVVEVRKFHKDDWYTISYSIVKAHPRNKWQKVKPEFTWCLHNIF